MNTEQLTADFRVEAERLGFTSVGFCQAASAPGFDDLRSWVAKGYSGKMNYFADRLDAYRHPDSVLEGVRSIAMLAMNYSTRDDHALTSAHGKVSRYAWGERDYHDVVHERLKRLVSYLRGVVPDCRARGVVDTAPLLERQFSRLAGLGWVGKHTLLLNRDHGSWFFLAAVLTDVDFAPDSPFDLDHCGSCRACLDACPTDAFPQPYVLDATRCISYLTIELRDPVPVELREGIGDWLFGCDVCQDVCPWNRNAPISTEEAFQVQDGMNPIELSKLFELDESEFRHRFRHSPLWRAKRTGLLRNAAIVLGNQKAAGSLQALVTGLADAEPIVRGASAWALGKLCDNEANGALEQRLKIETDESVIGEIHSALDESRA